MKWDIRICGDAERKKWRCKKNVHTFPICNQPRKCLIIQPTSVIYLGNRFLHPIKFLHTPHNKRKIFKYLSALHHTTIIRYQTVTAKEKEGEKKNAKKLISKSLFLKNISCFSKSFFWIYISCKSVLENLFQKILYAFWKVCSRNLFQKSCSNMYFTHFENPVSKI